MKQAIFKVITILLLFSSCVDNIDKELKNIEPQVVVDCFFTSDEPFRVYITKSFSPYLKRNAEIVTDAIVSIFENGQYLGELNYEKNKFEYKHIMIDGFDTIITIINYDIDSFYTNMNMYPKVGNSYKILVNVPGHNILSALSYVPVKTSIIGLKKQIRYIGFYGEELVNGIPFYTIKFKDPPESNYYLFSAFAYNKLATNPFDNYKVRVHYYSDDPVIGKFDNETNQYELLFSFSDVFFNGQEYGLTFFLDDQNCFTNLPNLDSLYITLSLNNLSEDFEYYIKSLLEMEKNLNNPLAEPISVYSNIENGLGIFAGYSNTKDSINIYNQNY